MTQLELEKYCDRLVGRIWKILKIRESEHPEHGRKYLENLVIELRGASSYFDNDSYFMSMLFSLEGIKNVTDHNVLRRKVFECIDLCNKLKNQ